MPKLTVHNRTQGTVVIRAGYTTSAGKFEETPQERNASPGETLVYDPGEDPCMVTAKAQDSTMGANWVFPGTRQLTGRSIQSGIQRSPDELDLYIIAANGGLEFSLEDPDD